MINKKNFFILLTALITYLVIKKLIFAFYSDLLYVPIALFVILIAYKKPLFFLIFLTVIYEMFFQTYIVLWVPSWQYRDYTIILLFTGIIVQLIKHRLNFILVINNTYFRFIHEDRSKGNAVVSKANETVKKYINLEVFMLEKKSPLSQIHGMS
jgi:hypothetical protein